MLSQVIDRKIDKSKKNIIKLYEEDLRKIDNKYGIICYNIWSKMPSMLLTKSSRFLVSSLDTRSDSILFTNTMDKLIESKFVLPIYKCNEPTGGFKLTKYEIDFLVYNKGKVIPFEVKSNKTLSKKSIEEFKNKYSKVVGQRYFVKLNH